MKAILFNTKMVKAILDGRKTSFRLPIKKEKICEDWIMERQAFKDTVSKYKVDDILYVKEKCVDESPNGFCFKEDYQTEEWKDKNLTKQYCNHFNARIFLKVINVRVERLQDIDWKDIFNDGFEAIKPIEQYQSISLRKECKNWWINLWNSTAKDGYKYEDNPFVFVYEFETINKLNI